MGRMKGSFFNTTIGRCLYRREYLAESYFLCLSEIDLKYSTIELFSSFTFISSRTTTCRAGNSPMCHTWERFEKTATTFNRIGNYQMFKLLFNNRH